MRHHSSAALAMHMRARSSAGSKAPTISGKTRRGESDGWSLISSVRNLVNSSLQHLQHRGVHALVPGSDNAPAVLRRRAFPGRHDATGADDDRDQRHDVMGLEFGLDDNIDVACRQHAVSVAIAAVTGELRNLFDFI